jgi:hypothetical protein
VVEVLAWVNLDQQDLSAAVCQQGPECSRDRALADAALARDDKELEPVEPI